MEVEKNSRVKDDSFLFALLRTRYNQEKILFAAILNFVVIRYDLP